MVCLNNSHTRVPIPSNLSRETGDKSKIRDFLPADKQYLVTRGVPCLRRATSLAYTDADEDAERLLSFADATGTSTSADGDEWVETHAGRRSTLDSLQNPGEIADIPDLDVAHGMGGLSLADGGGGAGKEREVSEIPDLDDIPDMEEDLEDEDEATAAPKSKPTTSVTTTSTGMGNASQIEPAKDNLLQVRTYDVMISYDKYYQTPRVWLIGYDENRTPLTPQQIFQDISADHAHKTVTIEQFIHSASLQAASVHPCKHASVMKKVIERMNSSVVAEQLAQQSAAGGKSGTSTKEGKKKWLFGGSSKSSSSQKKDKGASAGGAAEEEQVEGMRVDFYLVVFLKFIASIVPTIEVDSTTSF
ncbi:Autophagy-related protein 3 [Leucoagaricus sp. SymC.cos]|nr:Autophagy-related protein 3 [Leucoagaricus sp. SymC.cos]